MTVLVTGGSGLLGSHIVRKLTENEMNVLATVRNKLPTDSKLGASWQTVDIKNESEIKQLIRNTRPDWVINCAAVTDVDYCEKNPETAFQVNAKAPEYIAKAAKEVGAVPCQISTDYVFGGQKSLPYSTRDQRSPIQTYGRTKAEAERLVRSRSPYSLIARISFLYGYNEVVEESKGVVPWILSASKQQKRPLYTDQFVSPTYVGHAAESIVSLILKGTTGIFHCNNKGCVTPYDLGKYVLTVEEIPSKVIQKASLTESDHLAPRPENSCLSATKIERALSREQPDWKRGVKAFLNDV